MELVRLLYVVVFEIVSYILKSLDHRFANDSD